MDFTAGDRDPLCIRLLSHIDHAGTTLFVEMCQFLCHDEIIS
jgi:hypothetical protein